MYVQDDPRAKLESTERAGAPREAGAPHSGGAQGRRFAPVEYVRFGAHPPQRHSDTETTWYARGQNFVVAYTMAKPGARLERPDQVDEYVLLVPERDMRLAVEAGHESVAILGHALAIVPPGRSAITAHDAGTVIRIFSAASPDLTTLSSNAASYAQPHPNIPPYAPWPAPPDGHRLRVYDLDVPPQAGRFGRIWRCSTLMINVHPLEPGPRDLSRLSPHHHEDFEQGSLALAGSFTHHVRWPWTTDIRDWREDDHGVCPAPSLAVIPPPAIHTS
ncbi:MAG: hypothetical protein ACREUG_14910, partial [Steroidobacteraceae bacterium]